MSTGNTTKLGLGNAVAFINATAYGTFPAGVLRVDHPNRNSEFHSFVFNELPQLGESPARMPSPLCPAYRCPLADALESLKGYSDRGALGTTDDLLRDDMVGVFSEPSLPVANLPDFASGRFGISCLKSLAMSEIALSDCFNLGTGIDLPVRSSGQIDYSEVNPQPALGFVSSGFRNFHGHGKHPLSVTAEQINFPLGSAEKFLIPDLDRNVKSTVNRPDGNMVLLPSQNSGVVDGSFSVEESLRFLVQPIGVAHDSYRPNNKLAGEAVEFLSAFLIGQTMEDDFIEGLGGKSFFGQPITSILEDADSLPQRLCLRRIGGQLNCKDFLHTCMILQDQLFFLPIPADNFWLSRPFLPRLQPWVSCTERS